MAYTDAGAQAPPRLRGLNWGWGKHISESARLELPLHLRNTRCPFANEKPRFAPGRTARAQAVARARAVHPRYQLPRQPTGPTIKLPIAWFLEPFWKGLQVAVRPPVAAMKRSMHHLTFPFPRECFEYFLECVPDGKAGLRRVHGRVQPTRKGSGVNYYRFPFGTPSLVAKILSFELREAVPRGRAGAGPWRRGVGGARLTLSIADALRNVRAKLMAMVCGTLTVAYREPTNYKEMPRMTLSFFVLTMDAAGHIEWPTRFDLNARATLRKLARREVQTMLADHSYPIHHTFQNSLTQSGESYLDLGQIRAAAAARKQAVLAERARMRAVNAGQDTARPQPPRPQPAFWLGLDGS